MTRPLAIVLLVFAIAGIGSELWVRKTFGTWEPWAIPQRIDVCGRRYHPSGASLAPRDGVFIGRIQATILALPVPLPNFEPTDASSPYSGCPALLALVVGDEVIPYGPPEGGP